MFKRVEELCFWGHFHFFAGELELAWNEGWSMGKYKYTSCKNHFHSHWINIYHCDTETVKGGYIEAKQNVWERVVLKHIWFYKEINSSLSLSEAPPSKLYLQRCSRISSRISNFLTQCIKGLITLYFDLHCFRLKKKKMQPSFRNLYTLSKIMYSEVKEIKSKIINNYISLLHSKETRHLSSVKTLKRTARVKERVCYINY